MLFDSIPIKTAFFSLLQVEIGVGNKIFNLFYEWITPYVELLSEDEVDMSNILINLQVHNK